MTLDARQRSRLHQTFVTLVFVMGAASLVDSLCSLAVAPLDWRWMVLAVLALVSGVFAVKVPALNATLSISETFLFSLVLIYGGAPAVVAVALDGLVVSLIRKRSNLKHVVFNLTEPALSMWVASKVYAALAGVPPLSVAPADISQIGVAALGLCAVYFVLNSTLNALAMATESGTSPIALWRKYFLWVSLNYFGGASIAVLLSVNSRGMDPRALLVIAPLVFVSYFTFKSSMGRLEDENRYLGEVNRLYLKVVETLAMAVDAKDQVTHGHVRRVQTYALQLSTALGVTDQKVLRAIEAAALLHDMGKLAVPEHILNKPGKLTPDEYERMKAHAPLGADMLSAVDFPYPVVPIVRHHHENWDGTGYPDLLKGEDIPIGARILSVVDCYDALRSHRPYRRALPPEQAMAMIEERQGTMYDPAVVTAFKSIQSAVEAENVDHAVPDVVDRFARAAREMRRPEAAADLAPLELRLAATETLLRLYELLEALGPGAALADICDLVTRHLRSMAPAELVVFYRRDESRDDVMVIHASGFGEAALHGHRIALGHGTSGWAAANRRSVINADPALDVGSLLDHLSPRFRSVLSVSLFTEESTVGAVTLYSTQVTAFTDEQRQVIELVSGPIAAAVERAFVRSTTDTNRPWTPDHHVNGHALTALLEKNSFWRGSSGGSLGVLCVAAESGADLMAHASVAVSQATRVADLIFRPHENQLVVLMPDCDPGAGQLIIERISAALPPSFPTALDAHSPVRVSFACGPHDGQSVRELLTIARRRLDESWRPAVSGALTVRTAEHAGIGGRPWTM